MKLHKNEETRSRNASINASSSDDDTVVFPLSSEEPYRRYYWSYDKELDEILVHDDDAVDLEWLESGNAPLLDSHRHYGGLDAQIGVIRDAWLENSRLYVKVQFSKRPDAQAIMEDVKAGIVRNVSVGYSVTKYEIDEESGTYRVIGWKPKEASFVPIPADTTVGMGRSDQKEEALMPEASGLPGVTPTDQERAEALENAINDITALAQEHNIADIGRSYIAGCVERGETPSIEVFRGIARSNIPSDKPLVNTDIGLNESEKRQFSLFNLSRHIFGLGDADFEVEASAAAVKKIGDLRHGDFMVPTDVMGTWGNFQVGDVRTDQMDSRQMQALVRAALTTGSTGTNNILTTDHLAGSFIENLRNTSAVIGAGATVLEGLDSDIEIPGGDQNIQANWLASEDADAAESNPTFRKVSMAPKDVAAYTDMGRRMLQQATISLEAYVRALLIEAHRIAIDHAALYGTGLTGIPEGVANVTGIGSVLFTAAVPTRSEIIDLRTSVASTNRGAGGRFLGNSNMVGDLQKTKVDAGSGIFLMNDSADRLVGNAFRETNQITDGDLFYGYWQDLLIGMWGGLELGRSTESKFLSGGLRLRSIQTVDTGVTRVGSFALGNDG